MSLRTRLDLLAGAGGTQDRRTARPQAAPEPAMLRASPDRAGARVSGLPEPTRIEPTWIPVRRAVGTTTGCDGPSPGGPDGRSPRGADSGSGDGLARPSGAEPGGAAHAGAESLDTGSGEAPLSGPVVAGALEAPADGRARSAVLLVGPVGREQAVSTSGLVLLSRQLAQRGCLVLRLSLRGSGDSHGLVDDELRSAWQDDVRAGLRELRRRAPGARLHAVGLRLGAAALLDACTGPDTDDASAAGDASRSEDDAAARAGDARTAAEDGLPTGRVVLWEPVGGRAQLRRDVALRRVGVPRETAPDGVEVTGMLWTPGQAQSLRSIPDPTRAQLPGPGWSLRIEEDRQAAQMLWAAGSEFSRVPRAAVGEIVEHLLAEQPAQPGRTVDAQRLPRSADAEPLPRPVDAEPLRRAVLDVPASDPAGRQELSASAAAAASAPGRRILEEIVRMPDGRPAVLSRPHSPSPDSPSPGSRGPAAGQGAAVQLIAASSEPADGPTGLWAVAARELAALGHTVLRAERPGCGVLTDTALDTSPVPYDREVLGAVGRDAAWLHELTGRPVTAVGLCVGSWLALRSARHPVTQRVVAVNNVAWRPGTAYYELIYSERGSWDDAPGGYSAAQTSTPAPASETPASATPTRTADAPPEQPDPDQPRPSSSARQQAARLQQSARRRLGRLRDVVERWAPAPVRHGLALAGVSDAVSSMLLRPGGAREIDLVLGAEDLAAFRENRGDWGIRMAARLGRSVRVHDVPSLDHALLAATGRREVRTMLTGLLARSGDDGDRAAPTASGDAGTGA